MTKSQKKLMEAKAEVSRLWKLKCEADGVSPDSQFVVFTPANPYDAEYNAAVIRYQERLVAERKNAARRAKHAAYTSCGLVRVKGALGGVYYE